MNKDIIIDPEFKALIPPLAPEEYAQLEANIKAEGCRDPLVVWNNILIDGHNRHEICTKHGIGFECIRKEFPDRSHAIEWIIKNQFGRRNLSAYQRTTLLPMSKPVKKPKTGDLIRIRRIEMGMTQKDLAKKCKWKSDTMVAHYEAGRTVPLVRNLIKIAKVLKCKFQDLLPQ